MGVVTKELSLETHREGEMVDITSNCQTALTQCGISDGSMVLFVPGSTAAVTTIEFEPGLKRDFPKALERIAPNGAEYEHEKMWHDGNGRSHVKAALLKPDLTVPFTGGKLLLGTWQQIVFVELDIRPRKRKVVVQFLG